MKNKYFYTILFFLLCIAGIIAQAPQSMKYQAVARNATGTIIENQSVSLRVSILKSTVGGEIVFSETHNAMTNQFGMINLDIGKGALVSGEFEAIKWGEDEHFIRLEMDATGGSNYQMMGTTQLLSVPYALFSGNGVQFDDDMECNENTEGTIRYNSESKTIEVCDGTDWVELGEGSTQFACGMPLVDARDGKVYATVAIGSQCWMAENLNFGTYKESVFENDDHADVTNNGVVEKYALDNNIINLDTYGGLYDWNEMMLYTFDEGAQGICPDGWHVPTYDEWQELIAEVGGPLLAGKELKMGGSSGFNYPLGGSRLAKGGFSGTTVGGIWTSSPSASHPTSRASVFNFLDAGDNIQTTTDVMIVGKSCRCLKD